MRKGVKESNNRRLVDFVNLLSFADNEKIDFFRVFILYKNILNSLNNLLQLFIRNEFNRFARQ
jgi:hypothetical protein